MKKYIAAISGGPDSMAMLDLYKKQILAVCHINYNKRPTAKRDELFVKKYCEDNNIKFFRKKISKLFYLFHRHENFQNLARQIRYNFFVKIGEKINCNDLLIAHTQNDFVETAYLQKTKKTKTLFYGIKENSEFKNMKIFRPLIDKKKQELIDHCTKKKVPFGVDETNNLEIYERNKIRKEIGTWSAETFTKFLSEINLENKKNNSNIKSAAKHFSIWEKSNYEIKYFSKLDDEIKSEVIKHLFQKEKINYRSKEKFSQVIDFIENSQTGKAIRVGNNKFIKKSKDNILFI